MVSTGSRKRVHLSSYPTYEDARLAKDAETRYPQNELQIKKRLGGRSFDLVARITIASKNTKETN
jgi:hypothetical protein